MNNCVKEKKSNAAAAPSSSRKRSRSQRNGGVNKRSASRSKTKLRVDNTNEYGGVDTSNEINPASKQNDKNDYGLDPSFNNLSNNYNATHDNNNNKVSKSPNDNYEENFSGSTPASTSPPRTPLQNTKQVLLPSPPIRGNGNNNSKDIGSSAGGIKSILSSPFRKKSSRHRQSLGAPQQSKHHTSGSTNNKLPQEGNIGIGDSISTNGVQHNGSSNYVTKLMFANKNVLKIIPTLREQARKGYPLCVQAVKEFDLLESRNLEHAIANELAPEIKKEFRECSIDYTKLLGPIANRGQDLPDDLEKSAIGFLLLFGIKSSIDFTNTLFPPDKMDPFNCCLMWVGGHMLYSALLQAGTDSSVLNPQMARDFLAQNSAMFDAFGACCPGNDIDPKHPDKKVRNKADPKGNKVETIKVQLEKIAEGELCGLTEDDRMKFWEFYALLFIAWRGQYYYVKSGGKQYTLVVTSFTAANFCQDNPNREVLDNQHIQILTLTHTQVQMYMMPNKKIYTPPVVVKLDRHLQILLDKLDGKLLPDGETQVVASGMTTYFRQRAKLLTRDGNAIDDPTTEAWKVFHEDESKLAPEQRALLEKDYCYQTFMAWKDAKLHNFDLSKLSEERRAILDNNICYQTKKAMEMFDELIKEEGMTREKALDRIGKKLSAKHRKAYESTLKPEMDVEECTRLIAECDKQIQEREAKNRLKAKNRSGKNCSETDVEKYIRQIAECEKQIQEKNEWEARKAFSRKTPGKLNQRALQLEQQPTQQANKSPDQASIPDKQQSVMKTYMSMTRRQDLHAVITHIFGKYGKDKKNGGITPVPSVERNLKVTEARGRLLSWLKANPTLILSTFPHSDSDSDSD